MDCPDEIATLKHLLGDRPGVKDLSFQLMQGTMAVTHDPAVIGTDRIVALIRPTGMTAQWCAPDRPAHPTQTPVPRGPLRMTLLAGIAAALGLVLSWTPTAHVHHTTWPAAMAYLLAIGAGWRYVLPKAWSALRRRQLDMNVLMSIAVAGAVMLGEWFEAATVAFLFMLSHLLESWSVARARRAIASLMDLTPPKARVLDPDGTEQQVDTQAVAVGNRILVKPGEKFPLDGRLVEGRTSVDQAPITGESVPVAKQPGDEVYAATINQDGAVVVEVTKRAGDTVLAGVIRLVEQAQAQRSPSERFVDRFARIYTPAVVVAAVLLAVGPPLLLNAPWATWCYRALILLVIACPCALVISTPVTIVSGLTAAARNGVLIKGGQYLEAVGRTTVVALDKTGTLTRGRPTVQEVIPLGQATVESVLSLAAAIEQRSEHPIAEAIVEHARAEAVTAQACQDYQAVPGKGAEARVAGQTYILGNHRLLEERGLCPDALHRLMLEHEDCDHTVVAISSEIEPQGVVLLADALRPEAVAAVAELRRCGVGRVVMLTGDNAGTAKSIADKCGGIEYRAELLPADKVDAVADLKTAGGQVMMVGDGINDAPALAAADIGVAIGTTGSDVALETADVALMTDDLSKLPWLIGHGRRTRNIIVQNVALALAIKGVFLGLAIPGLVNLWMAIAADMGASLLVTFNGLRLLNVAAPLANAKTLKR
ncbi:MAG: cadmium-translocating P-type ATPase [Planctomycetes bacterium]|nr:cadmium-translocating P-type ATPase [Planctomycetota bacterium]